MPIRPFAFVILAIPIFVYIQRSEPFVFPSGISREIAPSSQEVCKRRNGFGRLNDVWNVKVSSKPSAGAAQNNELKLSSDDRTNINLEIVLFGVGDMRVSDHEGLQNALSACLDATNFSTNNSGNDAFTCWVPLVIFETNNMLPHLPQSASSLLDSAHLLWTSMHSVDAQLRESLGTNLNILIGGDRESMSECVLRAVDNILSCLDGAHATSSSCDDSNCDGSDHYFTTQSNVSVSIHACDLGEADNSIGYGPYSTLKSCRWDPISNTHNPTGSKTLVNINVTPWQCNLRSEPWQDLQFINEGNRSILFPDRYPDYVQQYSTHDTEAVLPIDKSDLYKTATPALPVPSLSKLPSLEEITSILMHSHNITDKTNQDAMLSMQMEKNTGIFLSHWGNLPAWSISERDVHSCLDVFCNQCNENDAVFFKSEYWKILKNSGRGANPLSLEHASMNWLMGTTCKQNDEDCIECGIMPKVENLIKGEVMTRFLAAPLLFGTISPRQVWHYSKKNGKKSLINMIRSFLPLALRSKSSCLVRMVEGREWHRLLAARSIRMNPSTFIASARNPPSNKGFVTNFGYWRWQGFLCRYEVSTHRSPTNQPKNVNDNSGTFGVVFVHGFGASGSQWRNTSEQMLSNGRNGIGVIEIAAPDIIGYGQSEKPPISYVQYLWESHLQSFIKEICIRGRGWESFVLGGNSVGGYTAMATCADDTIDASNVSHCAQSSTIVTSSGTLGTGRCRGLILINTSGPIFSKEEKLMLRRTTANFNYPMPTVAQRTSAGSLEKCRPFRREIVALIGKILFFIMLRLELWLPRLGKLFYKANPDVMNKKYFDVIIRDSMDPGVINVIVSISKLLPKRTAKELLAGECFSSLIREGDRTTEKIHEGKWSGPVLIIQGYLDPLNAKDRAQKLVSLRDQTELVPLQSGHCPHDEQPAEVAKSIMQWFTSRYIKLSCTNGN